jgi:hypothetical protein
MDAGFHENLVLAVAAESKRFLSREAASPRLGPLLAGAILGIKAKNRVAHDMPSAACRQGLSIAHICPQ